MIGHERTCEANTRYKVVDGSSKKGEKIPSHFTNSPISYWGYCVECHGYSWNHDEKNGDDWDDFRRQWSVGLFQKVPQKLLVATATRVFEHIWFLEKKAGKFDIPNLSCHACQHIIQICRKSQNFKALNSTSNLNCSLQQDWKLWKTLL